MSLHKELSIVLDNYYEFYNIPVKYRHIWFKKCVKFIVNMNQGAIRLQTVLFG